MAGLPKINRILFFLLLLVCYMPSTGVSAPVITSSTGAFSRGGSATIAGTSFGLKSTALPQVWDNFEAGVLGQPVSGHSPVIGGAWSDYYSDTNRPIYSNIILRGNSSRSSRHQFGGSNYNVALLFNGNQPEYFFTYWWYFTHTGLWPRNIKPWFMFGNSSDEPHAYSGYGDAGAGDSGLRDTIMDGGNDYSISGWGSSRISEIEGQWVRFDVYLKQSTPNVADGAYEMYTYINGQTVLHDIDEPPVKTRSSSTHYYQQLMMGTYCSDNFTTANIYLDDIYIDSTQARVEICDKSTWSARTHCEIQIPTFWSNTSISFTVNPGSFSSLTGTYIYVVDKYGSVNSNGMEVGGGSTPTLAPNPPLIQSIQ